MSTVGSDQFTVVGGQLKGQRVQDPLERNWFVRCRRAVKSGQGALPGLDEIIAWGKRIGGLTNLKILKNI
jgi:hypothetical protein